MDNFFKSIGEIFNNVHSILKTTAEDEFRKAADKIEAGKERLGMSFPQKISDQPAPVYDDTDQYQYEKITGKRLFLYDMPADTADLLIRLDKHGYDVHEMILNTIRFCMFGFYYSSDIQKIVLRKLIDYMKNSYGYGLYEYSQEEIVKYVRMICPVPWKKIYFRAVKKDSGYEFNYCYEEKDTGYIISRSTEEKRYGYILEYRRIPDLFDILSDKLNTFSELYPKDDTSEVWKAVTFTAEKKGKFKVSFEYDDPADKDKWEFDHAGRISSISDEYPAEKLAEDNFRGFDFPTNKSISSFRAKDYYDLFRKCYDYMEGDYISWKINGPAAQIAIDNYIKNFDTEPDSDFIEWLGLCDGFVCGYYEIYSLDERVRDEMYVDGSCSYIAKNLIFGYGISYETGKCMLFDHGEGSESGFLDILSDCMESLRDDVSEFDDQLEMEYLIKNGRVLSDDHASFLFDRFGGIDRVRAEVVKARRKQLNEIESHRLDYYFHLDIVSEYKENKERYSDLPEI